MSPIHTARHSRLLPAARSAVAVATLVLLAGAAGTARANIDIVFDYTYDTGFFNSNPLRKNVLEAAALAFESRLTDNLTAITSGAGNTFNAVYFNPVNPSGPDLTFNGFNVATNVVLVFVGASNLGGALGVGGPGGYSAAGSGAFLANAATRGQNAAFDFGPWGGSISFDNASTNWYFDANPSTVETFTNQYDFYSVAVHELGHVLGMGTSTSWKNRSVGTAYNGPAAGAQTVTGDKGHWVTGTQSSVGVAAQEAAMTPSIGSNERKYFTTLDYAGMNDIGWQVSAVPEPTAWLMWTAGGLLVAGLRRRSTTRAARPT
jgi:Matrixin